MARRSRRRTRTVRSRSRKAASTRRNVSKQNPLVKFLNRPTVQGSIYGLARKPVNDFTNSIKEKIPFLQNITGLTDEMVLYGMSTVGSSVSSGSVKRLFKTTQAIEAHNIAREVNLSGVLGGTSSASSSLTKNSTNTVNGIMVVA